MFIETVKFYLHFCNLYQNMREKKERLSVLKRSQIYQNVYDP